MKNLLFFILMSLSFLSFAGKNGAYKCDSVPELNAQDYSFDVISIKRGDQKKISSAQKLDLSVYSGKVVLLNVFSPTCSWCLADLFYFTQSQKIWSSDSVVMVNLSYGPNGRSVERPLETSPEAMLHFVKEGYQQTQYGQNINVENMDFYHIVDTQTGRSAFDSIKQFKSVSGQELFPKLGGTPYSVLIDEEGKIRFRGHFTSGDYPWQSKFERHYGFVTSLINNSCEVPSSLPVKKSIPEAEMPLTKTGLRIAHSETASCYDQDQVYKRCVDQNQIFEMAKEEAKSMNKDLLLIYGYDNCGWCRAIHNLMYFSDKAQKFQDAFHIRTIAKSSGNDTGEKLIEALRSSHNVRDEYGLPYLIRIEGQTGEPKDFINTDSLEQNFDSWNWQGYSLEKVMKRLLGATVE